MATQSKTFNIYYLTGYSIFLVSTLFAPLAAETRSTAEDQTSLNLTIYNAGRALIRDTRQIKLLKSTKQLAIIDVAEKIMPQTVAIDGLQVLEQNYDFDLLSPQALINKNIGKTVRLARRSKDNGETLEWSEGTILSVNGGVILKMPDGSLESLQADSSYHLVFNEILQNLRTSPTLSLLLQQPESGLKQVELTYLTTGLSWQSDYVLQLNDRLDIASLDSWITLNNQSGISYNNAGLQLLAGDVNMQQPIAGRNMMAETARFQRKAMSPVNEQALHGYHLYTVAHKTTLNNRQSKQIKLFETDNLPVTRRLEDQAYVNSHAVKTEKSKPDQYLTLQNRKPALGRPLPKGIVRVYANDDSGNKQFIGEDSIGHTAVNDEIEIKLGKAFDITVERSTKDFRQLSKKQTLLKRSININNGDRVKQTVVVSEIMPAKNWKIKNSSHDFSKSAPSIADFEITIPALSERGISYDVVITYP